MQPGSSNNRASNRATVVRRLVFNEDLPITCVFDGKSATSRDQQNQVIVGSREWITPGVLPSALRAVLRTFKFVPDEFVEPVAFITLVTTLLVVTPRFELGIPSIYKGLIYLVTRPVSSCFATDIINPGDLF